MRNMDKPHPTTSLDTEPGLGAQLVQSRAESDPSVLEVGAHIAEGTAAANSAERIA
jgi:hypothetical protein